MQLSPRISQQDLVNPDVWEVWKLLIDEEEFRPATYNLLQASFDFSNMSNLQKLVLLCSKLFSPVGTLYPLTMPLTCITSKVSCYCISAMKNE